MIMASWSCNIILYGTVFDLGGKKPLSLYLLIIKLTECSGPTALVWGTYVQPPDMLSTTKFSLTASHQTHSCRLPDHPNVFRR